MKPAARLRLPLTALLFPALALLGACDTIGRTAASINPFDQSESGAEPASTAGTDSAAAGGADAVRGPSLADMLAAPEASGDAATELRDAPPAEPAAALPEPGAPPPPPIPHIYLALQPGGSGHAHSAVFAIDAGRDGTPSDDPAIRLTPEGGNCNPQEMRRYAFPSGAAPVVSEAQQARGLTARDLPAFLAAEVTGRMIEAGLAAEPEATRPLNVCTRKLWERLVVAGNQDRLAGRR